MLKTSIESLLGGLGFLGLISYVLVSIASTILIAVVKIWFLFNFFDLIAWAEGFGIISIPLQIGIVVIALAGVSITILLFVLTAMIIIGGSALLYNEIKRRL